MKNTLDAMLLPGERELRRWRGGWLPHAWPLFAVLLTPLIGYGVFLLVSQAGGFALVYLASLLPGLAFFAHLAIHSRATQIVLTDRRLLHRAGGKRSAVTAMALTEITEITWFPGSGHGAVKLVGGGDQVLILPLQPYNEDLPATLAEALGQPAPHLVGVWRMSGSTLVLLCGWMAGFGGFLALFGFLPWNEIKPLVPHLDHFGVGLGVALGLLLILPVVMSGCFALGVGLSLVAARFLLDAEEFRRWLASEPEPNWVRPLPTCAVRPALWLAGLLYGRALRPKVRVLEAEPPGAVLDAGESVVFQAWRRFPPWGTRQFWETLTYTSVTALYLYLVFSSMGGEARAQAGHGFDPGWTEALVLAYALLVPLVSWAIGHSPGSLLVTDRRLVFRSGRGAKAVQEEIALSDITGVRSLLSGVVEIARRDGAALLAEGLPHGARVATAVARAAGVPPPELPPRGARLADRLWFLLTLLVMFGGVVPVILGMDGLVEQSWGIAALAVLVIVLPFWFLGAPFLTLFLMLGFARVFAGARGVAVWLDRKDSMAGHWIAKFAPWTGPLVGWLTGRPNGGGATPG